MTKDFGTTILMVMMILFFKIFDRKARRVLGTCKSNWILQSGHKPRTPRFHFWSFYGICRIYVLFIFYFFFTQHECVKNKILDGKASRGMDSWNSSWILQSDHKPRGVGQIYFLFLFLIVFFTQYEFVKNNLIKK